MYSYILENKLKSQRYVLILGGSNLKLSQIIGKNIIKKFKLHITHIITKSLPPHNGCPTKIKKRKKNKGRNRRLKRVLQSTKRQLPTPKDYRKTGNVLFGSYSRSNLNIKKS